MTAPQVDSEYLTVPQVAAILGVSVAWVYDRIEAKTIPSIKFGRRTVRIGRKELDAWLAAHGAQR